MIFSSRLRPSTLPSLSLGAVSPSVSLGAAVLSALVMAGTSSSSYASSHREAPFISTQPSVDGTDFYMFRSYESGRAGYVTMIADYIPFQDPQGGPNFFMFNSDALYAIKIDNNGDGHPDISFQFQFKRTSKAETLPVGSKAVQIPLIDSGPISGVNPPTLNVEETFTVNMVMGDDPTGPDNRPKTPIANASGGTVFDKPVDNIGDKTFGGPDGYAAYASQHVYSVSIPGCGSGRVFVGQRKEPFFIAVGKIFDLVNLNPLGPEIGGNKDDLAQKNISSIELEVPISCLTTAGDPVIGAYTTASLPQTQTLSAVPDSGLDGAAASQGQFIQVSRVGMPLVNEVVIGLNDKNKFNASRPSDDPTNFADYVTNPTLPALLQSLFPVKAPTNFPRTDLLTVFLTGIKGLNQPANVKPAEMLRLNTGILPTPQGSQSALGVAGGDTAGFPNGRRPGDDVVDLSLRVSMGALCVLSGTGDALHVGCGPADAPSGGLPFTDGVRNTASSFQAAFPYLGTPIPGSFNN